MPEEKYVKREHLDRVLRLTVDRPEAMNAANSELLLELMEAIDAANLDPEVRVIVLTGAGDRAFVSGADIKEMSDKSPGEAREFSRLGHRLTRLIEEIDKPVIAALNGSALGGGCELAIACDLRIAGDKVRLGQPEVKLGLIPGWGGTIRLARLVGEGLAREMIFTGKALTAEEALRVGLVNAVVPHDTVAEESLKVAVTIAAVGPVAIAYAKRSIQQARSLELGSAEELEADLFALCFATEDCHEGLGAFVEKRPPTFRGR